MLGFGATGTGNDEGPVGRGLPVRGCGGDIDFGCTGLAGCVLELLAARRGTLMPTLDFDRLRAYRVADTREAYDARDVVLYALGTGAGLSPDIDELDLVFERDLKVLPTFALVLGTPGFWPMDPRLGLDWPQVLHGEQSLRLHRPLDPQGDLIGTTRIGSVADKGLGKPALLRAHRTLATPAGVPVAEMDELWILRGAGGFGGERHFPGDTAAPAAPFQAEAALDLPTSRQQAMIYRLSGDRNPLHVEPGTAGLAGFDRPILHGLSTMGLVARAIVHLCAGGDPARLSEMAVRFTSPVYPGETVRTELVIEDRDVRFRAIVPERQATVIDNGRATLDTFAAG